MESSDSRSNSRLVNSFMVGVGLGLLVGLFWAPRVGKETRDKLRQGADDGLTYLREEVDKIRENSWLARLGSLFCRHRTDGNQKNESETT
jgi:hypothetical protein